MLTEEKKLEILWGEIEVAVKHKQIYWIKQLIKKIEKAESLTVRNISEGI